MRKVAIIGGLGYLVIFFTGIFANFFVLEELKVVGDEMATLENFQANVSLFMGAIIAFVGMVIFDVVLTWVLYVLFKEQETRLSKWAACLRLINAGIFGAALFYLVVALDIIVEPAASKTSAVQLTEALSAFNELWLVGLVFFGLHLILLSVLLCRSKRVFKLIPGLLTVAGLGYLVDTILQFYYEDYNSIAEISAFVVVLPGVIGELSLTVWLLFKAGKENKLQTSI
jgi:hypothetical protein